MADNSRDAILRIIAQNVTGDALKKIATDLQGIETQTQRTSETSKRSWSDVGKSLDVAGDALKKVGADLKTVETQSQASSQKSVIAFRDMKLGVDTTTGAIVQLGDQTEATSEKSRISWSNVATGIGIAAGAVTAISGALLALGARGADVGDVRDHFKQLTTSIGESADAMLGRLRDATLNTISDFELMKGANLVLSNELKLTADDMGVLGDAAGVLADRVGGDTAEAYRIFTEAVSSGKDAQLRQLGLTIDTEAALKSYGDSIGKTVQQLSEQEKKQATANAIVEKSRDVVSKAGKAQADFGDSIAQSKAKLSNWVDGISEWVSTAPAIQNWAGVTTLASGATSALGVSIGGLKTGLDKVLPMLGMQGGLTGLLKGLGPAIATIGSAALPITLIGGAIAYTAYKVRDLRQELEELETASNRIGRNVQNRGEARDINAAFEAGRQGTPLKAPGPNDKAITLDMAKAYQEGRAAAQEMADAQANAAETAGQLKTAMQGGTITIRAFAEQAKKSVGPTEALALAKQQAAAGAKLYRDELAKLGPEGRKTALALLEQGRSAEEVAAIFRGTVSAGTITRYKEQIADANRELKKTPDHAKEVAAKIREMSQAADVAARNGALEAWARQNGEALEKLAVDASSIGKRLTGNLFEGMLSNMKAAGAAHFKAEFDRIIKEGFESWDKYVERQNTKFDASLGIQINALNDYSSLVAKRTKTDYEYQLFLIQSEEDAKIAELRRLGRATVDNLDMVRAVTAEKMAAARQAHNDEIAKMKREADSWGNRSKSILESIPDLFRDAMTGGGGMKGFGQALVSELGEGLVGKGAENLLNKGIQGLFNKGLVSASTGLNLAGFVAPIAGMLGSLVGPLISNVFGKIFGPTEYEKRVRENAKQMKELTAAALESAGSMEILEARAHLVGIQIREAFKSNDAEFLKKTLGEVDEKFAKLKETVNTQLGSIFDQAVGIGFRLPETLQPYMDRLKELGLLSEENAALLSLMGDTAQIDYQRMEEAAGRYGISVDKLGQGFNNAKISASVAQILEDYDLLTRGGAEPSAVLEGMADEISEVANRARSLGISMPENMRPILQALADKGLLLDANGKKIENLNGMTFGDPIKVGLDRIIQLLETFLEKLGIQLPKAASTGATEVEANMRRAGQSIEDNFRNAGRNIEAAMRAAGKNIEYKTSARLRQGRFAFRSSTRIQACRRPTR